MLGKDKIIELLSNLTQEARKNGAGQAEALYAGKHASIARFANSKIIQNIKESDRQIYFMVLLDKKLGIASTNSLHMDDLRRCLKKATAIARESKPLKFFDSLPEPSEYPNFKTHFPETANLTISDKIKMLEYIFKKTNSALRTPKLAIKAGGAFSTLETEIGIVNSNGIMAYQPFTSAHINLITSSPNTSGFACQFERNTKNIDTDKLISTAIGKTVAGCRLQVAGKKPKRLKPGKYTVILEPAAVNEILEWLVYIGFGAMPYIDGTSFMAGNLGKKIMDKNITIYDDASDLSGFPVPFDFEGVSKKRLDIVKNGVAKAIAFDSLLAKKRKKKTTGHALIPEEIEGPFPSNIFIKEGSHTIDEMASMVERGIIVTRFHYVNGLLDTKTASMTGMTRDGTFHIEDGKIKYPVEDMRFTESILEAFSRIEAISKERQAFQVSWSDIGASIVPALLIRDFNFSG
ncbi:MAG: TldD/PmbA family protein [Deltaproteobacteria bacterium]|nr:TldD/PmbA family protein [Deltaproteobacteria bacterium]